MPSSGKSRRHRKNRPSDSKHNKQHNSKNNGATNGSAGGPAVTAALGQSPVTSPMEETALPLVAETPGGGKPDEEVLSAAAVVEMAGPPLPADATMMEVAGTPSDEDDPAFNAFNYWKTPFPDVNADVIME